MNQIVFKESWILFFSREKWGFRSLNFLYALTRRPIFPWRVFKRHESTSRYRIFKKIGFTPRKFFHALMIKKKLQELNAPTNIGILIFFHQKARSSVFAVPYTRNVSPLSMLQFGFHIYLIICFGYYLGANWNFSTFVVLSAMILISFKVLPRFWKI